MKCLQIYLKQKYSFSKQLGKLTSHFLSIQVKYMKIGCCNIKGLAKNEFETPIS